MQPRTTNSDWARLFSNAAAASLPAYFRGEARESGEAPPRDFADGHGRKRESDIPLLSTLVPGYRHGTLHGEPPAKPRKLTALGMIWWSLLEQAPPGSLPIAWKNDGPLLPELAAEGVEIWQESELSALHALSWRALRFGEAETGRRAVAAAGWAIDEIQPDNSTQLPWAAHVFAALSLDASGPEPFRAASAHYAETLLHNALVGRDRPDVLSAVILESSARWLIAASTPPAAEG